MDVIDDKEAFRRACDGVRLRGERLGVVPTMGALHAGHLRLVAGAAERADRVAVTLFVNPTQFGPNEDFARYPRTLGQDLERCAAAGVSLVFTPSVEQMYPPGERTRVRVDSLTEHLCGRSRPVHFEGVTTIVTKLLSLAGPCVAVFGRKDYQQLKVVQRLCTDLLLPAEIVGLATVREPDGLALSSRNAYLSAPDRARALAIPRALSAALAQAGADGATAGRIKRGVEQTLTDAGLRIDYATVADPELLQPLADEAPLPPRVLVAVAAYLGNTRLIDNVVTSEDPPPIPS